MCMICLSINGIFIKSLFYALNPPFLTSLSKVASLHPSLIVAFTLFMLMCKCMVGFLLQWIFVSVICQCLIFNIFFSINTFLVPDICKKKKIRLMLCVSENIFPDFVSSFSINRITVSFCNLSFATGDNY